MSHIRTLADKVETVTEQYRRGLLTDVEYHLTVEVLLRETPIAESYKRDLDRITDNLAYAGLLDLMRS